MKLKKIILLGLSVLSLNSYANKQVEATEQISSIDAFSMASAIRSVVTSPNGKNLAILRATTKDGDYIIEIRDPNNLEKDPVRLGADKMLISSIIWLNDEKIGVMFRQILEDGNRKYWVNKFAITDADGKGDWLLPFKDKRNVQFQIINRLPDNKDEVLVEVDINNNYIPDVVRFNINTGRSVTIMRGNEKISGSFVSDYDGDIRIAQGWNKSDNAIDHYARVKGDDDWKVIKQVSPKKRENFEILGFTKDNPDEVYINANLGENTTGIYIYNIKTAKYSTRQFGLESVDTDGVILDSDGTIKGFRYTTKQPKNYYIDPNAQALQESIASLFKGKFVRIMSRSDDDNVLVLNVSADDNPGSYYIVTNKQKLTKIGDRLPFIDKSKLGTVKYISYKARDGRNIKAYVTIPATKGPHPAVVLPHGGPWVRDSIIFDDWAQLLAYHGYVVIQPNYRGSTGYGLEHWIAGDNNWGLKKQDDLDDAAQYLVEKGLATKDKLALFGWSYGGYAAFAASMRENNIYQCVVAGAGVSDLSRINATLNENRFLSILQRPTISGVSPVEQVDKVNVPILIIHGDIDSRVPIKHSRDFVSELEKYKKDFKYIELEDADHFSDSLFYAHKKEFYTELLSWFDNKCSLK
ncbi:MULTISPECIES: prolyl oligopeptidase family serine peptidase [Pseudoalteromonas]|jgi:dipeptidyl aminopeptidase/acylaminoacyl peptidase|uniref:Prolyl oligopeptidase family serine peptidase n=1 Tax=Pseudoalteromonas sp. SD03 TaxID=3231719 RepID=A0AB39AU40_9GAMM|nr:MULTISPECIES: prolyl oligopeptidase family serine peptidase [Pseudoalteromonas]MAY58529.1 S9 family peptidase [Pseudoalteromonas sp.]MDN3401449.1 prolyl oligopeptidase family serine peptidase [Pseudoalteromonas sp. APC 3213]MDN3403940.1 prolyl oligopeptidase family serine peptidase [Pseudoalteromonas sp. APC 3218]MDN3410083.1 prolyl oligopeptidase family serine peptidase [Pseudoalteromonas sp. APC 3894]MDN3412922.1 prolyl oligopeptidase family serine peptidase [Pseudoalteromonas sp. APC 325|tara:strand:- start:461 stop:2368 length:1908 start_codon:yes stop_codon:yes gene_type:complete